MDSNGVVAMFKALGDPTRLRIFEFLCSRGGPVALDETGDVRPIQGATVGEVCCQVTGHEKFSSTVSFHLRELRLAGLVCSEKSGKFMVCSVNRNAVAAMAQYLNGLPQGGDQACR
jgi:DNA-binding transcriptional ArsR family regulator